VDPLEMKNLAHDPASATVLGRMRDTLKKTLEETEYPGGYK
jgi:hypothetical protein